jgi:major vault protein
VEPDESFFPGQLLVIKGTETSFFIPPTGFEVVPDKSVPSVKQEGEPVHRAAYVREALTLERLEYAILLDEDGNKRYERGPQVVFPEATEKFVDNREAGGNGGSGRKFKAVELNDQMGLYIKVIADYDEEMLNPLPGETGSEPCYDVPSEFVEAADRDEEVSPSKRAKKRPATFTRHFTTGEELFITGARQRIYYPRPEHALIEYDDPKGNFKRQRYYGITIPKGEARYILDKRKGDIVTVYGPQIYLPDPRFETVVRRVLDEKTTALWYPGNEEAVQVNATYAQAMNALSDVGTVNYLDASTAMNAMADLSRGINRGRSSSVPIQGGGEVKFARGGTYTAPPTLTLSTKYEGVPTIGLYPGYAVQVVDKAGAARVVVGPANILLAYDETLTVLSFPTGTPKNMVLRKRDVYLRLGDNMVTDKVRVETKDRTPVDVTLRYVVTFDPEQKHKWFAVESYVQLLCERMASWARGATHSFTVEELLDDASEALAWNDSSVLEDCGAEVKFVDVVEAVVADTRLAGILVQARQRLVEQGVALTAEEQALAKQRQLTKVILEANELTAEVKESEGEKQRRENAVEAAVEAERAKAEATAALLGAERETQLREERAKAASIELAVSKAAHEEELDVAAKRTGLFKERMAAITPGLVEALQVAGDKAVVGRLSEAVAPLAIEQQTGIGTMLESLFKGTPVEQVLDNIKERQLTSGKR